jgi:hypothetical protein
MPSSVSSVIVGRTCFMSEVKPNGFDKGNGFASVGIGNRLHIAAIVKSGLLLARQDEEKTQKAASRYGAGDECPGKTFEEHILRLAQFNFLP